MLLQQYMTRILQLCYIVFVGFHVNIGLVKEKVYIFYEIKDFVIIYVILLRSLLMYKTFVLCT